jgi:hypothetical protein
MAYCVVNLDRMAATKNPDKLFTVNYYVSDTRTAIQNGSIVTIGDLDSNTREAFKATAVSDVDASGVTVGAGKLFLIASPEYLVRNEEDHVDFTNPTTESARAYMLCYGDVFGVTKEGFYGTTQPTTTNKYVTLYADGNVLMTAVNSASNNKIGEFIGKQTIGGLEFYFIRVCA